MKPNRRLAQRLGALVLPILGVLLAGCGGRLTEIDGDTPGLPPAQPAIHFWVTGTAYLEGEATTRAFTGGDIRLGGATVRVLRRTRSGVSVYHTGAADAEGNYNLEVEAPVDFSPSDLWELEAFATGVRVEGASGSTVITNVLVFGVLMPASGAVLNRDVNIASTIVGSNMEAQLAGGSAPGAVAQSEILAVEGRAAAAIRVPPAGGVPVRLSAVSSQQGSPDDAHTTVVSAMTESAVSIFNSLVSQVRVLVNGTPASQVIVAPGSSVTLTAQALDASGNPVLAGIEFAAQTGGGYVTLSPSGTNRATLTGRSLGTAVIVGRVAVPGQLEIAPVQRALTVIVASHPQGTVIAQ